MIIGMDHVAIATTDLNKVVDFYTSVLGFEKGERYEMGDRGMTIQFLKAPGVQLELFGYSRKVEQADRTALQAGLVHLAIKVRKLDELRESLRKKGITFEGEPRVAMMGQRIVFLRDPDGNRIELSEWPE